MLFLKNIYIYIFRYLKPQSLSIFLTFLFTFYSFYEAISMLRLTIFIKIIYTNYKFETLSNDINIPSKIMISYNIQNQSTILINLSM